MKLERRETEMRKPGLRPGGVLSDLAIRSQLKRILVHREFLATDKMRDFLRFVVEETLAGRSKRLKGFTIATEVYGRDADFDAAHDPVVRIQAGRLRRAMERYYLVGGVHDSIRIDIPKGTYVPVFTALPRRDTEAEFDSTKTVQTARDPWPTILVTPFENITGNPDLDYLGQGLASELSTQLGDYSDLRVISYREGALATSHDKVNARFTVEGTIRSDGTTVKILVQLIETATGEQLWTDTFDTPKESINLLSFQEKTVGAIVLHLACEQGIIARKLSAESASRVTDLSTHEAILKSYAFDQNPGAKTYLEAFEALQGAVTRDPHCSVIQARLALLYSDNIALEFFGLEQTPLEEALHLAQKAVLMEPNSQFNRLVLARIRMLNNELDAALVEVEAAQKLNQHALQYMDVTGYLLLLLGQWERGEALVTRAMRLNPFYRVVCHYGLWLNHFRKDEFSRALKEIELILGLGSFWEPLVRAATQGQMNQVDEARHAVRELLAIKPNFPERGKILIRHYIKFVDIEKKIITGLQKAGLQLH